MRHRRVSTLNALRCSLTPVRPPGAQLPQMPAWRRTSSASASCWRRFWLILALNDRCCLCTPIVTAVSQKCHGAEHDTGPNLDDHSDGHDDDDSDCASLPELSLVLAKNVLVHPMSQGVNMHSKIPISAVHARRYLQLEYPAPKHVCLCGRFLRLQRQFRSPVRRRLAGREVPGDPG